MKTLVRPGRVNRHYWIVVFLFLCVCKEDRKKDTIMQMVAEWTGKEILFPAEIPCRTLNSDTVCVDPHNPTTYKIMLYVDSAGCNSCRLKLLEWKRLMAETDTLFSGKVDFLLYYQPKNSDVKELEFQMRLYDFRHPVFMDTDNLIGKANRFPPESDFQCFLLDGDNKVVLIGNPVVNPKIWELYKQ